MLRLRVLTSVIGLPLIILSLMLGPLPFGVFLSIVAGVCTYELCRIAPELPKRDLLVPTAVALSIVLATVHVVPVQVEQTTLAVTVLLVVSLLRLLDSRSPRRTFAQWSWTIAGALYVGWLLGHWGGLYMQTGGIGLVFFGMFTTFFYDTFAYFSGRAFGRHKLAPHLSGGKTWEGVGGGLAMAVVGGLVMRVVLIRLFGAFPFTAAATAAVAVCLAAAAQTGDLVESALKRSAGVKDAGGILPGHGGMLDRFDSLLFVGPMLYYLTLWVAT